MILFGKGNSSLPDIVDAVNRAAHYLEKAALMSDDLRRLDDGKEFFEMSGRLRAKISKAPVNWPRVKSRYLAPGTSLGLWSMDSLAAFASSGNGIEVPDETYERFCADAIRCGISHEQALAALVAGYGVRFGRSENGTRMFSGLGRETPASGMTD